MYNCKSLEDFKDIYDVYLTTQREAIIGSYWYTKPYRLKFGEKKEDFVHINLTTTTVLEGLKILLDMVVEDRNAVGVQKYINFIVSTLQIHLDKIEKYLKNNNPKGFKTKENTREEYKFQRLVFKGQQELKTELKKLNIDNNNDNLVIEFFNNEIATLPMKDVLYDLVPSVALKIDSLDVDWDLIMDNGFFINMKKSEIPDYKKSKHFWDQDKKTLEFFISEYNKIKHGITIDGYYIHGWLYFHLNYFKTRIGDEGDKIINPPLRDNEWYWGEILKNAEKKASEGKDAGVFVFGTRRFSKSTCEASLSHYKIITKPSMGGTLTATNEKDIMSITDKINIGLEYVHPAFYVESTSRDWKKQVKFGMKEKSGRELKLFYLSIINTDSGSKSGGQKTAGFDPVLFVMDEAGKEKFLEAYNAAIPSFETSNGWKCTPFFVGTGGQEDLSAEAEKVLSNPSTYRFIEMDWDLLEWQVPKEAISWTRRPFGYFIPGPMGYKTGFKRIKRTFSDFLQIESKELEKITILQTDWVTNLEICKQARASVKNDISQLQQEVVFYPLDPEECFMSAKTNPFNAQYAKKLKDRYVSKGNEQHGTATPIRLRREGDNIVYDLDPKSDIAIYPHQGGFVDAPGLLFGEFPKYKPPMWQYVAGLDLYKHEMSDGDSVCGFYIFDRVSRKIVYSLASRPDPYRALHKEIHMALDAWNCKALAENEDLNIKEYLDRLGVTDSYLEKKFDAFGDFTRFSTNRKYGWQPDKFTAPFVRTLVIDYTKEISEIKDNKDTVIDVEKGIDRIEDIHLLEEFIKYKDGGNFDRIVGFGSCLLYDYYLTSKRIFPRTNKRDREEVEQWRPKKTAAQRRAERRRKLL